MNMAKNQANKRVFELFVPFARVTYLYIIICAYIRNKEDGAKCVSVPSERKTGA